MNETTHLYTLYCFYKTYFWACMPLFWKGQCESVTGNQWETEKGDGSAKDLGLESNPGHRHHSGPNMLHEKTNPVHFILSHPILTKSNQAQSSLVQSGSGTRGHVWHWYSIRRHYFGLDRFNLFFWVHPAVHDFCLLCTLPVYLSVWVTLLLWQRTLQNPSSEWVVVSHTKALMALCQLLNNKLKV